MSKKAYKYRHVKCTYERPSERSDNETHSEIITLWNTDEGALEKVAVIHNELHFGGRVNGVHDTFPYHQKQCPCGGGTPPLRAWNGDEVVLVPYDEWAGDPEVPVLYLGDPARGQTPSSPVLLNRFGEMVRSVCKKVGIL